jgi:hypothetical protein
MMRYKDLSIGFLVLIYMLLTLSPAHTQDLPLFQQIGVLNAIYLTQERLVIYDVSYRLPKHAPVYRFDPDVGSTKPNLHPRVQQLTLTPGMRLGYTAAYNRNAKHSRVIKEVWIWPPGSFRSIEP